MDIHKVTLHAKANSLPVPYKTLLKRLLAQHQPQTETEKLLVGEIAATTWQLDRIRAFEMSLDPFGSPDSVKLHRTRAFSLYTKALERLQKIQAAREAKEQAAAPVKDGFVFSNRKVLQFPSRKPRSGGAPPKTAA